MTAALRLLLDDAVSSGVGSGAEVVVMHRGAVTAHVVVGGAARVPSDRPHADPAWWDLASLTKPLVAASIAYALIERGELRFDDLARTHHPSVPAGVTVAQLLSHSAGYTPWVPLHVAVDDAGLAWGSPEARAMVLERAATHPLAAPPGTAHAYSDLGYLALTGVLERIGGARLDRLFSDLVTGPLHSTGLQWGHPNAASTRVCPRRGVIRGEVDDDNCAAMGGVSSHAGLFGTAVGVAELAQAFLSGFHGHGAFDLDALREGWTRKGAGSHWLGWDGRSGPASGSPTSGPPSSSGSYFPEDSVGHLGFTGTSVWIAPSWELLIVLLTNRVHPSVDEVRHKVLRRAIHDAVAVTLGHAVGAR